VAVIIPATGDPVPAAAINATVRALQAGQLAVIPTDTVYGLAADAFGTGSIDRIFAAKRRPRDLELPVLVAGVDQALELAIGVTDTARTVMEKLWPGAITVVVPCDPAVSAILGSDDATIGLRWPDHPVPEAVCRRIGPITCTSANLHGRPTPPTAAEVAGELGDAVAIVLDGGPCTGSPSTVVDCTGIEPKLLREGRIPWDDVLSALK
jgi:L-threonylcarbamoyladenylate synthase